MLKKKKENNNEFCAKLVVLYYFLLPIYLILQLKIGIKAHFTVPIIYLLIVIKNYKRLNFKFFIYVIIFFLIQMPYSLYKYYNYLYNWFGLMYLLFICSLPWFVVGNSLDNLDALVIEFKKNVLYILVSNILLILFCKFTGRTMLGNMEISYTILPLVMFSLLIFLREKNIKFLIISIFSGLVILIVGSRGPLLCIACFILFYHLFNFNKKILYTTIVAIIGFIIILNLNPIIDFMINSLENYGISSRTLYKLKNGDILNDTGRGKIQDVVWEELNENPIMGLGLGGERIIVNERIYNMSKDMSSCYPHNFIIEVLSQYGYIWGMLIIIFLLCIFLKALEKSKENEKNVVLLLFSMDIIKLFLSSSYIMSPMFFLLLGICFNKDGGKNR